MIFLSAIAHAALLGLVFFWPREKRSPGPTSYTVELVGPDALGGTNLAPRGKKAEKEPAPKKAPPKVAEKPAPRPAPAGGPERPPVAEVAKKPAPEKPEPRQVPPQKPEVAKKPEPAKKEIPSEPAPRDVLALAKATAVPTATRIPPSPTAQLARAEPTAVRTPTPVRLAARPPAKAAEPSPARRAASAPVGRPTAAPTRPAGAGGHAGRAGASSGEVDPARLERERQIAEAIARVQRQIAGGGTGTGPLSVGPGSGPGGGELGSIEYVRYVNHMTEKIKENWVWAGGAGDLETVIAFSVLSTGEIVNIRVLVPSGNPTYDLSAVRAVQAANPLPPPPFEFADQFARVEYTFRPEDAKRE